MRRGRKSRTRAASRRAMQVTYFMLRLAKGKKPPAEPESLEFLNGDPVKFVNLDTVELT